MIFKFNNNKSKTVMWKQQDYSTIWNLINCNYASNQFDINFYMNNVMNIQGKYRILILCGFVSFCIFIIPKYGYLSTSIYLLCVGMSLDYTLHAMKLKSIGMDIKIALFYAINDEIWNRANFQTTTLLFH